MTPEVTVTGAIAHITLRRPDKRNALDRATLTALTDAFRDVGQRDDVKVVVVRGEGPAFCGGFDLGDPEWAAHGGTAASAPIGRAMADAVAGCRAVTIAAVHGHCVGGGVVLAAACDLRIAATDARFRIPEVDLGVPLFWNGIPLLRRAIGPARTKELVMTGRPFSSAEAEAYGLVQRVVEPATLGEETTLLAASLAAKPRLVLDTTKAQVDDPEPWNPEREAVAFRLALEDPEGRASARRYLEGLR